MTDCWDETAGIDIEQRLGFLIRINLDVLIWDAFKFERYPRSLDEWANTHRLTDVIFEYDFDRGSNKLKRTRSSCRKV